MRRYLTCRYPSRASVAAAVTKVTEFLLELAAIEAPHPDVPLTVLQGAGCICRLAHLPAVRQEAYVRSTYCALRARLVRRHRHIACPFA